MRQRKGQRKTGAQRAAEIHGRRMERSAGVPVGLGPDDQTPLENRLMIEAQDGAPNLGAHRSKAKMPRKRITLDDCLDACEKLKSIRQADGKGKSDAASPETEVERAGRRMGAHAIGAMDSLCRSPEETHRERWTRKLTESRERNRVRKLEVATDAALRKRAKAILEDSDD